ncbi:MAG TPA: PqqD family protein [Vicinamibacterales bacterium]|nr:PqqD family protein [Vicinamibacterales bacterium]
MTTDMTACIPKDAVRASIHDSGIVLFHTQKGRLFAANSAGACIWQGLERRLPIDAIVSEVSQRYRIAEETARIDAVRFISELERERLVSPMVQR